jgi:hypothetical protein
VITREWLVDEIKSMQGDLEKAVARKEAAREKMRRAGREYAAEAETVENIEGCLRGLRDELDYRDEA